MAINDYVKLVEDEFYELYIELENEFIDVDYNGKTLKVKVECIAMNIAVNSDEGESDLAVCWDTTGIQKTEEEKTSGIQLLMHKLDGDEMSEVMGAFYWQHKFDARLKEILVGAGFSEEAADIDGSEWGMQDEGRASYDADGIADEVRKAMA